MIPDDLEYRVMSGSATDAELEQFFGPDLINQGTWALRLEPQQRIAYLRWYEAVLKPLEIDHELGLALFSGEITIEDFAKRLDNAALQRFVDGFEDLQIKFQEDLERKGRI